MGILVLSPDSVWIGDSENEEIQRFISQSENRDLTIISFVRLRKTVPVTLFVDCFLLLGWVGGVGLVVMTLANAFVYKVNFDGLCTKAVPKDFSAKGYGIVSIVLYCSLAPLLGVLLCNTLTSAFLRYLRFWVVRNRALMVWLTAYSALWPFVDLIPDRDVVIPTISFAVIPVGLAAVDLVQLCRPAGCSSSKKFLLDNFTRLLAIAVLISCTRRYADLTVALGLCSPHRKSLQRVIAEGTVHAVSGLAVVSLIRALLPTKWASASMPSVSFAGECHYIALPAHDEPLVLEPFEPVPALVTRTESVVSGLNNGNAELIPRPVTRGGNRCELVRYHSSSSLRLSSAASSPQSTPRAPDPRTMRLPSPIIGGRQTLPPTVARLPPLLLPVLTSEQVGSSVRRLEDEHLAAWCLGSERVVVGPAALVCEVGDKGECVTFPAPSARLQGILEKCVFAGCLGSLPFIVVLFTVTVPMLSFRSSESCFVDSRIITGSTEGITTLIIAVLCVVLWFSACLSLLWRNGLGRVFARFLQWWLIRQRALVFFALPLVAIIQVATPSTRKLVDILLAVMLVVLIPVSFGMLDALALLKATPDPRLSVAGYKADANVMMGVAIRFVCVCFLLFDIWGFVAARGLDSFGCGSPPVPPLDSSRRRKEVLLRKGTAIFHGSVLVLSGAMLLKKIISPFSPAVPYSVKHNLKVRWGQG